MPIQKTYLLTPQPPPLSNSQAKTLCIHNLPFPIHHPQLKNLPSPHLYSPNPQKSITHSHSHRTISTKVKIYPASIPEAKTDR